MQKNKCNNINILDMHSLITPKQLKLQFPLTYSDQQNIIKFQNDIINIINKRDSRLLIICGPCSIHDIHSALDYANRLKALSIELQDQLFIVMRVYLEKPRTTIGWKGLINDPYINGSCDIEFGLKNARHLLLKLNQMELPLATEVLNPYIPQYIGDLFSWVSIGARTTESQVHREVASGFRAAIGFKNSTSGDFSNAINAIQSVNVSHRYISINQLGQACLLHTTGNPNGHLILRGGICPNYYPEDIARCEEQILTKGLPSALMIDCSHGNSNKDYRCQTDVAKSVLNQIKCGNCSIIGLMFESYIHSGNQDINFPCSSVSIKYGVSITDACIDWKTTEYLLRYLSKELKPFLVHRVVGS